MASLLIAIIYLAFVSLGLPDSLLGSAWPVMRMELCADVSYAGYVSMIVSFCTVISSLFSQKFARRFGDSMVIFVSVLMSAGAMFGFAFSKSFWMILLFAVPYGLGAGAIDAVLNNYVALHLSSKHMNWLHCFWGVGATLSPNIMSFAISTSLGWRGGYGIVAVAQLFISFIMFASIPLWKKAEESNAIEKGAEQKNISIFSALKIKGVPLILVSFFCYCFFEMVPIVWSGTYFSDKFGLSGELSARFASMFFIGITSSRAFCGLISNKLGDRKLIRYGGLFVIASAIFVVMPWSSYIPSLIGFILIGIGCGPIYPSIIHSAPINFGEEYSGTIIGLQMAGAYIGNTISPTITGNLVKYVGSDVIPYMIIVLAVTMLILTETLNKKVPLKK